MHHSVSTGLLSVLLLSASTSVVAAVLPDVDREHPAITHESGSIGVTALFSSGAEIRERPAKAELVKVPIPSAVWLFGSGLIGLISVARRTT